MALLTLPALPAKGINQSYTLNVTDLIALVTEAYFQDQLNWSKVVVLYQSAVSNQLELINFIPDGVSTSITSSAQFSTFARNIFEVHSITIFDNQNGRYTLKASQIPSVQSYAIVFTSASASGLTYFPQDNSGIEPVSLLMDSGDILYTATGYYGSAVGGLQSSHALLDVTTNSADLQICQFTTDARTKSICFNTDLTKAYAVGPYNGLFNGKTFQAPASYLSSQVVEIDLVSGDVVLVKQLEGTDLTGYPVASISYYQNKLLVKTAGTFGKIALIDIATSNIDWIKQINSGTKTLVSGSSFYTIASSYDSIDFPSGSLVLKCNIANGVRDTSLPNLSNIAIEGSGRNFDVSPTGKIFAMVNGQSGAGYYYNGTAWVEFQKVTEDGGLGPYTACIDPVSEIVYVGFVRNSPYSTSTPFVGKYDTSTGVGVNISNITAVNLAVNNSKLIAVTTDQIPNVVKYNIVGNVATKDSSFTSVLARTFNIYMSTFSLDQDKIFLMQLNYGVYMQIGSEYSLTNSKYFSKYNVETGEIIAATPNVYYPDGNTGSFLRQPAISPLMPDKIIACRDRSITECDKNVYPFNFTSSGWPTINGNPLIFDSLIVGEWLYLSFYFYFGCSMTDAQGVYTSQALARININTKLIDRTFNVDNLVPLKGNIFSLSASNDYVYASCTTPTAPANVIRIKKSDNTVETFTDVASFNNEVAKVCIDADGRLIVLPQSGGIYGYVGDRRPYAVVNEADLQLTGTQPEQVFTDLGFGQGCITSITMNPVDKLIYATGANASYGNLGPSTVLAKYNPVTNTRQAVNLGGNAEYNATALSFLAAPIVYTQDGTPYLITGGNLNGDPILSLKKVNANLTIS